MTERIGSVPKSPNPDVGGRRLTVGMMVQFLAEYVSFIQNFDPVLASKIAGQIRDVYSKIDTAYELGLATGIDPHCLIPQNCPQQIINLFTEYIVNENSLGRRP